MKAYYINLDRSVDRRDWFERQAHRLGIEFERVTAVDAAALPEPELARRRAMASGPLTAGEIGCFLSHLAIWKSVAEGSDDWVFVAEDDVHLTSDAKAFLETSDWLPPGAELVKAETTRNRVELTRAVYGRRSGYELRRLKTVHLGSAGYFLSRQGARQLVAIAAAHCEPADLMLFSTGHGMLGKAMVLQLQPAICIQDFLLDGHADRSALMTTIGYRRRTWDDGKPKRTLAKIRRELVRIWRQAAWIARWATRTATLRSVFRRIDIGPLPESRPLLDKPYSGVQTPKRA